MLVSFNPILDDPDDNDPFQNDNTDPLQINDASNVQMKDASKYT